MSPDPGESKVLAEHAAGDHGARALPNALGAWREVAGRLRDKRLALFLDYDGTLTPIAPRPELATLGDETRSSLEAVARVWPTAIVSGRSLEDVRGMVGLPDLLYAGSHGFDVCGPGGLRLEMGREVAGTIRRAAAELRRRTEGIPGVLVEDKRLSLAVHLRGVAPAEVARVEASFRAVSERRRGLKPTEGKRVLELRPAVEWDKGRAVLWILQELGLTGPDCMPVYVGDDVTDEDAFRALAGRGLSVRVGEVPWSSAAEYALADAAEVRHFMERLGSLPQALAPHGRQRPAHSVEA